MNSDKKFFSKIGTNYLIFGISALILQIIAVTIIGAANPNLINDFNILVILTAFCNYILPFPIFYYLMKKIKVIKLEKQKLSLKTFLIYIATTFTLMWIGNIIGLIITAAIGTVTQTDIANPVQELINSSEIWLNLALISIIGPIFEELFFRKLLIDRSIKYGAKVSIILSATIFAFFHGNLNQFFYAFLIGGFFAYVYIKTGKIIYPIILHIIVNLMGSIVSLFVVESADRIVSGTYGTFDVSFVVIYVIIILVCLLIGLITLSRYKKAKFNGAKTEIALRQPWKTMILNYGMIFFMAFFIFQIVYQLLA
ncbi:CPBP family intramembrane glutamic endopeptidase [uncultured Methanobrevibacter sp.]|uniref:CPBP family intramembrane glutamic endopeptidase n=1 Tax=uncultured Methanobrevibacter sp. TaxID=253161 RepID=UPI00261C03F4|nr:type II CAAX endopeptidase family protein [uncultured Methanobrevibacter sp.]